MAVACNAVDDCCQLKAEVPKTITLFLPMFLSLPSSSFKIRSTSVVNPFYIYSECALRETSLPEIDDSLVLKFYSRSLMGHFCRTASHNLPLFLPIFVANFIFISCWG
jgi:hypothetical protein